MKMFEVLSYIEGIDELILTIHVTLNSPYLHMRNLGPSSHGTRSEIACTSPLYRATIPHRW